MSDEANHVTVSDEANHVTVSDEANHVTVSDEAKVSPFFSIIKGNPTDTEVAALVAVLLAAGSGESDPDSGPRDLWGLPELNFRSAWGNSPLAFSNDRFSR